MVAGEVHVARRDHEAFVDEVQNTARQTCREIGTKIERAVFFYEPGEIDARIFLGGGELDVGIGLVIAKQDVEFRPIFLDEVVLERQGFAFVADDNGFQVGNLAGQRAGLGVNPARLREVGAHATAQVARLANIQHGPAGVLEEIRAGAFGKLRGFFAGLHGNSYKL